MVNLKIIPLVLKWFVLVAGLLYLIITPLTSSVIQCIDGKGCLNVLRDTGGLLFNEQQNIKEFGIRIMEEAPKNPDVYDKIIIDSLKSNILINLGLWLLTAVSLFFLFMMIIGKIMSNKILIIFISILLSLAIVGILSIAYNLIIYPHHFVNPYEGIMYLWNNPQIFFKIGSDFQFPLQNITLS